MAEINTTRINDLPTDPSGGGSVSGNVNLAANEMNNSNNSAMNSNQYSNSKQPIELDQTTISQIVNGLQQASLQGVTQIPSRDIPLNTGHLSQDAFVQPNYVPPPKIRDYIKDTDDDINNYYKAEKMENSLDSIYDELQTPLLLAVLYFIFQLPIIKKSCFKYMPFLCYTDGNYNINGLLFTCIVFGLIYYSLSKSVKYFGKF